LRHAPVDPSHQKLIGRTAFGFKDFEILHKIAELLAPTGAGVKVRIGGGEVLTQGAKREPFVIQINRIHRPHPPHGLPAQGRRTPGRAIPDLDLAADQFHALAKAGIAERILFDPEAKMSAADSDRTVRGAMKKYVARLEV
jgi:hypothetical protein